MVNIDKKDKKILYHLDLNSRQSLNSIGKKVGLTKDVVAYRIQRMQKHGIIKMFRTYSLFPGKMYARNYYIFQNTNPIIKSDIIKYFINKKSTTYVISLEGSYDLLVNSVIDNSYRLDQFLEQTQIKYGDFIEKQVTSVFLYSSSYDLSFLLNEKTMSREIVRGTDDKKLKQIFEDNTIVDINELDAKILKILSLNARIPTTEIAKQLNSTATIIHYRIKKLIKSGIIYGFGVVIDMQKIGYRFYHININLKNYMKRLKIIDYIRNNPHMYCIEKALGETADLELEFYLENVEQLHRIMGDLSLKFPESIKNFNYFSYLKVHKASFMPLV